MTASFISDPAFWVFLSFIGFLGLSFKPLRKKMNETLDKKSQDLEHYLYQAAQQLEGAKKDHADAQETHKRITHQLQDILKLAYQEIDLIHEKNLKEQKEALELKKNLLAQQIKQRYLSIEEEIRLKIIDLTLHKVEKTLPQVLPEPFSSLFLSPLENALNKKFLQHNNISASTFSY